MSDHYGIIKGTVYDPSGAVKPDTFVMFLAKSFFQFSGLTEEDGSFFTTVETGQWEIAVLIQGFVPICQLVTVKPNKTVTCDIHLTVPSMGGER